MVSAINTDQSELWELLMNQSSQTNSSSSTTQTQESSEADSTSFANLLQESSENNSVDSQLYDMLTDITQNMGVPAGMTHLKKTQQAYHQPQEALQVHLQAALHRMMSVIQTWTE